MSDTIGWGILATGGIAEKQTADLQRAGMLVAAVGSRGTERARAFAERFSIPHAHGSYDDLVTDPTVDIVYVATPHPGHVDAALAAIAAGKHVLVEKPFTLNAAEAERVVHAAGQRGVAVMEAMWTRFLPSMRRVMEIIESGAIGAPRVLLADHNQYIPRSRAERLHDPELGGGALLDLGIYPVSFASSIFGKPARVTARATLTDLGVDELTAIICEYAGGAQASLHTGFLTAGPNVASVVGEGGRVDIDAVWYNQTSFTHYDRGGTVVERYEDTVEGRGMQFQALELERVVRSGTRESPTMPLGETLEIMRTMDEIRAQIAVTYPQER